MKANGEPSSTGSNIDSLFYSGGLLASTSIEDCHGAIDEIFRPLRAGSTNAAATALGPGATFVPIGRLSSSSNSSAQGPGPIGGGVPRGIAPAPPPPLNDGGRGVISNPLVAPEWAGLSAATSASLRVPSHDSGHNSYAFAKQDVNVLHRVGVGGGSGGGGGDGKQGGIFSSLSGLAPELDGLYPNIPASNTPTLAPSRYPSLQYNDLAAEVQPEPRQQPPMRTSVPRHMMGHIGHAPPAADAFSSRPASSGLVFHGHLGHDAAAPPFVPSQQQADQGVHSSSSAQRHANAGAGATSDRDQYRRYLQEQHRLYIDLLERERLEIDDRSAFQGSGFDAAPSHFISDLSRGAPFEAHVPAGPAHSRNLYGGASASHGIPSASSSRSASPDSAGVHIIKGFSSSSMPASHAHGPPPSDISAQDRAYYTNPGYQSVDPGMGSVRYFPSNDRSFGPPRGGGEGTSGAARSGMGKQLQNQQQQMHLQQQQQQIQLQQQQHRKSSGPWVSKDRYSSSEQQSYGVPSSGYVHASAPYQQHYGDKSNQQRGRPRSLESPGAQSRNHQYPDGLTFNLGGKSMNPQSRDFTHNARSHGLSSLKTMVLNMRGCLRVFKELPSEGSGPALAAPIPASTNVDSAPPGFVFDTESARLRSKLFDFIGRREVHVILMYNTGCLREDDLRVIRSEVKAKFKTESAMWASFCCPPDEPCRCCADSSSRSRHVPPPDATEIGRGTAVLMLGPLAPRAGWVRSDSSVFPMPTSADPLVAQQGQSTTSLADLREHNKACGGLKFTFATVRIKAGYSDVVFMSCDLPIPQPDCTLTADCEMTIRWRNSVSKLAAVLAEEQNKGKNLVLTGRVLPSTDTKYASSCQLSSILVSEAIAVNAPVTQQHFVLDFLGIMVARGINLILVTNRGILESDSFEADRFGISVFVSAGTIAQLPQLTPSGSASVSRVVTPMSTPPPTPPSSGSVPLRLSSMGTPLITPPGSPPHALLPSARPVMSATLNTVPLSAGFEDELRDDMVSSALNSPGESRSQSPYDFLRADPTFNGETYISSKLLDYQQMKSISSASSVSNYSGDVSASTSARTSRASSPVDMSRGKCGNDVSADPASRSFAAHIRPQGIRTHLLPQNGMFPQSSFLRYMNQSVIDASSATSTVKTDILESFSGIKVGSGESCPRAASAAAPAPVLALELMAEVKGWPRKAYEFPSSAAR